MKSLFFSLLLLSSVILNAQDKSPALPRFSIRASCGIPKYVSSQLLQHAFSGVVTGDATVNYKLFSNFLLGQKKSPMFILPPHCGITFMLCF